MHRPASRDISAVACAIWLACKPRDGKSLIIGKSVRITETRNRDPRFIIVDGSISFPLPRKKKKNPSRAFWRAEKRIYTHRYVYKKICMLLLSSSRRGVIADQRATTSETFSPLLVRAATGSAGLPSCDGG